MCFLCPYRVYDIELVALCTELMVKRPVFKVFVMQYDQ